MSLPPTVCAGEDVFFDGEGSGTPGPYGYVLGLWRHHRIDPGGSGPRVSWVEGHFDVVLTVSDLGSGLRGTTDCHTLRCGRQLLCGRDPRCSSKSWVPRVPTALTMRPSSWDPLLEASGGYNVMDGHDKRRNPRGACPGWSWDHGSLHANHRSRAVRACRCRTRPRRQSVFLSGTWSVRRGRGPLTRAAIGLTRS